jgi:peptide deformylase
MAVLPVYNCFHPVLRNNTEKVTEFNGELKEFIDNMYDTMYNIPYGVGLAANQVGESKSLLILDLSVGQEDMDKQPITMINPVIEIFSDEIEEDQEGCLSIPDYYEKVPRSKMIRVKYSDIDMKEHTLEAEGFLARVIQHETDHLFGKLIFDRISPLKRTLSKSKLKKIERGKIDVNYTMVMPNGDLLLPDQY